MGTNILTVLPRQSRSVGGRARTGASATTLKEADYRALRRELPAIARGSRVVTSPSLVKAGDLSKRGTAVVGCEPEYVHVKDWALAAGRFLDAVDMVRSARVVVLGARVARDLFGGEAAVGQRLRVNRVPFEVIGVLTERGQGLDAADEDDQLYVPLTTAQRRLTNVDYYGAFLLEVDHWSRMDDVATAVGQILRARHSAPLGVDDFEIANQKRLIETEAASSARLTFWVRWIGGSVLLVSGFGCLAVLWLAVRGRHREFGTLRAIGATANDVLLQVACEAALLSTTGGLLGVATGWLASRLLANRAGLAFQFAWPTAGSALAVAIVLHLGFALAPARKAARTDPILALRR